MKKKEPTTRELSESIILRTLIIISLFSYVMIGTTVLPLIPHITKLLGFIIGIGIIFPAIIVLWYIIKKDSEMLKT